MKKALKLIGYLLGVIVLIIAGLTGYVKTALPDVGPAPGLKIDPTTARVERGKYLANCVTACVDCHSTRDWSKFAGPMVEGTTGKGGERFDQKFGFPGVYYSRNITPYGISRYTDGELYRLITTGVTKEGKAMFPVMPYPYYGKMDPEDINSIIAYLRTLQPIKNDVPESVSDFPMSIIINTIPKKSSPTEKPDHSNPAAYGAYLANACGCVECHTKADHGQIIPELAYSGGREFALPDGSVVRSSNITSSVSTGIGNWTQEAFINRFKAFADSNYKPQNITPGAFNTIMPWGNYGHMTNEDLAAIYTFIHNLKPIENQVEKFTPAGMAKK